MVAKSQRRFQKRGRKASGEELRQKWFHNSSKVLHKVFKKAKEFETRKILRRIAPAGKPPPDSINSGPAQNVDKLRTQLAAVKQVDLDRLVLQVMTQKGWQDQLGCPVETPSGEPCLTGLVTARLLGAACVRKELAVLEEKYKRICRREDKTSVRSGEDEQKGERCTSPVEAEEDNDNHQVGANEAEAEMDLDLVDLPESPVEGDNEPQEKSRTSDARRAAGQEPTATKKQGHGKRDKGSKVVPLKPAKRMGQRARRLLAERKYGMAARHLQASRCPSDGEAADPTTTTRGGVSGSKQHHGADDSSGDIHPSWAARRQQKVKAISLGPPRGKKVVFDDDEGVTAHEVPVGSREENPGRSPALQKSKSRGITGGLHAGINRAAAFSDLHPSWAAKKKLAMVIAEPQGKKIMFED